MYLLAPFILQNFKKILRADPELWGCAIFGPKMAHLPWTKFFWYKPLLLLSSTYWPFSLCKILKNSYSRSRVMRMCHFWAQNGPLATTHPPVPQKKMFRKIINIILIYLLAPSLCKILKKFFQWMCNFWVQNDPFSQMRIFSENLLMSLVSFIHAYLHARNLIQILIC